MNYTCIIASINLNAIQTRLKLSLFHDFVKNSNADIIFCQEVAFNNFSFIFTHHAIVNVCRNQGTAILIRKGLDYDDIICDPNSRIVSVLVNGINYINVYGHAGFQLKKERETLFAENIAIHLNKAVARAHVLGGDFNCILDPTDTKGNTKNFCNSLKVLTSKMALKDVEKALKNQAVQYTFMRGDSASRIDRFYASQDLLKSVLNFETWPVIFSDHRAILMKISIQKSDLGTSFGRGYWKINTAFINDDECENEFCFTYEALQQRHSYENNFMNWWTTHFKSKVKNFFNMKSIEFNRNIAMRKSELYKTLIELSSRQNDNEDVSREMGLTKSLIFKIESEKLKYYESKLSSNSILTNERTNIYQIIARHKFNQSSRIEKLLDGCNEIVGTENIKKFLFNHFSENFKKHDFLEPSCRSMNYIKKKTKSGRLELDN